MRLNIASSIFFTYVLNVLLGQTTLVQKRCLHQQGQLSSHLFNGGRCVPGT
jgi:hypothetical protein